MKVEVYYNLHKRLFSVRALEGERKGRVIDHVHECAIKNAKFVVSEAGRQRVLREKCKNVHAHARGELVEGTNSYLTLIGALANDAGALRAVKYDPYRFSSFVDLDTEEPVHEAEVCLLLRLPNGIPAMFAV